MKKWIIGFFLVVFTVGGISPGFAGKKELKNRIALGCPAWMQRQIETDLAPYREQGLSADALYRKFLQFKPDHYIMKFVVKDNRLSHEELFNEPGLEYRVTGFCKAFEDLLATVNIPDVTFYLLYHDGLSQPELYSPNLVGFPLFVMSRAKLPNFPSHSILIPDYESLRENYQVLKKKNVLNYVSPWASKNEKLIWRGGFAQAAFTEDLNIISAHEMTKNTAPYFSRFILCELSKKYPKLIDAKYTYLGDLQNTFPGLKKHYSGTRMPYEDLFNYKYHIFIHGNAVAYTCSGWKFFTNSLLFIPKTVWSQWYFNALKPYEHFVPVEGDLSDLVEKIKWAKRNDDYCKKIARNAREFALENLTREADLVYIYYLLLEYSKLYNK